MSTKKNGRNKKPTNPYLRYSQLGFQMFGTIAVFAWLGYKIDHWYFDGKPIFFIILFLLGAFGAFYQFYRQIKSD